VCKQYAQARSPDKHLKQEYLVLLREYVIHELPSLLNGIDYKGNTYRLLYHPTLKTNTCDGNDQREAMANLLNYMREHYLTSAMCHIIDVEFPRSLIVIKDDLLKDSSESSSASQSDLNSSRSQTAETPFQDVYENSGYLWLILILQVNCSFSYIHANFTVPFLSI
jgi:hypothetical protein